jgi:membrane dipeptidase
MIDVSHVTDDAFFQVLRTTQAPIIASHSSCRYFTPEWERNMSDEMIRALSENGGVIQINFGSMFLDDQYLKTQSKIFEELEKYRSKHRLSAQDSKARAYFEELRKQHPLPRVDVWNVVDHINHVVELVGIDHVGLGSDFDGVGDSIPADLKDVSMYPNLIYALLSEGYSAEEIKKICGENLLRVWEQVEAFSESKRKLEK